jgi:methanogenic corrinoid protein MtbC1
MFDAISQNVTTTGNAMNTLNQKTGLVIRAQRQALAAAIVTRQYELQSQLWQPFGDSGREKSARDTDYHLAYLAEAIEAADPALFTEYVNWVKVLFAGLNFPDDVLVTTLQCTRDIIRANLPAELHTLACEYIEAGLARLPHSPATPPAFIQIGAPLGNLAQQYMDALLRGERNAASQLVLNAVDQGTSIKDIYLRVFQPAQREIGRLWQTNQVSVAQEHYCTAATQLIMSQLYPRIFAAARIGRRLVATCVGSELHELGIRMVADFFEMDGWDTYYLGANTPAQDIVQTLVERKADVLAISTTMTFHVSHTTQLVAAVRASPAAPVKIMVGGYPFNISPELWRQVGADGCAHDAQQAVTLANELVGG